MKPTSITSFRDLACHLTYEGCSPLKFDRSQCDSILRELGLEKAPTSYVEYFGHIGYVIWECFPDSLGISLPDPRPHRGIKRRCSELSAVGMTVEERKKLIAFGAIDKGISLCWDLSRINGEGEPAVVGVSEGKRMAWGNSLFDFMMNHWLTGRCGSEKVFTDIPEENLRVLALSEG